MVSVFVALLRGIAPTNPKMKNAELKRVFEQLGYDHVRTVISSGNVIFESSERSRTKLEAQIEAALEKHLGAPCSTIIRTSRQIDQLLDLNVFEPYDDGPAARCNVTFLKRKPRSAPALPRSGKNKDSTVLTMQDNAVFSVIDTTSAKTPDLMAWLEKQYGKEITTRTWKTVHRIAKAIENANYL